MAKMTRLTDRAYRVLVERRSPTESPLVNRFGYQFWSVSLEEPKGWGGPQWKNSLAKLEEHGLLIRTMEGNLVRYQ